MIPHNNNQVSSTFIWLLTRRNFRSKATCTELQQTQPNTNLCSATLGNFFEDPEQAHSVQHTHKRTINTTTPVATMPPKSKLPVVGPNVYVVKRDNENLFVFATFDPARERAQALKVASGSAAVKIETHELVGGTVVLKEEEAKNAPKAKAVKKGNEDKDEAKAPKAKATKKGKDDNEDGDHDDKDEAEALKAKAPKKGKNAKDEEDDAGEGDNDKDEAKGKVKTAKKGKNSTKDEAEAGPSKSTPAPKITKAAAAKAQQLPDNVKLLLAGTGTALSGLSILVTGVPRTLGRKNTEQLITAYGGKLVANLSKNTSYVLVGHNAGPAKMGKTEELGLSTLDEDSFIELLEAGGPAKRAREEDDDQDVEMPMAKKAKL